MKVTVQGTEDAAVLIDGMRVHIESREPSRGRAIVCPVGGAEASPRHVDINLDDDGVISYVDDDGETLVNPFTFTLSKGEVETFWIVATARVSTAFRWTAELLLIVNGTRETIHVSDDGDPFRTAGAEGLPQHMWTGSRWDPPIPSERTAS